MTLASPVQEQGLEVAISRRDSPLTKQGSSEVDWSKVQKHMSGLKAKYQKTMTNFEKVSLPVWKLSCQCSSSSRRDEGLEVI